MTVKLGAQDLVLLAEGLADAVDIADLVAEQGAPKLKDTLKWLAMINSLKVFAQVNYAQVLPEYEDMDDVEAVMVADAFQKHLNVPAGAAKDVITSGFDIILRAGTAIKTLMDIITSIRDTFVPAATGG